MSQLTESSATLEATPLLNVVISIADRRLSGTLVLERPNGSEGAVVFESGMPRKAMGATSKYRLSELMIELGWLDAASAEQTYAMACERHERHGQILLECRLVDEIGLTNLLRFQMLRKLEWLASWPTSTALRLHEGTDLLSQVPFGPDTNPPLGVIWELAKHPCNDRHRQAVFTRIGERMLRLHPACAPELFGFDDAEMALVQRLRSREMTLGGLLRESNLNSVVTEAMVHVLVLTRHIDLGAGRPPVGVSASPTSSYPERSGEYSASASSSPATMPAPARQGSETTDAAQGLLDRQRAEFSTFAARSKTLDYYGLLGVPREASPDAIRVAFSNQCRRYHPDVLPKELAELRPVAAVIQARLVAAYRTLADDQSRATYDRETPPPSSRTKRERATNRSLGAEALRRAELWLKRERIDLAEAEAARAIAFAPGDPRCIALYAWIRALKPGSQDELGGILASLTQALDLDPMNVQTRFYRTQILKRLNRIDDAVAEWRLIVEMQPNHIDSLRELRLWELRQGKSRPPRSSQSGTQPQVSLIPPPPGLFGRLFRK